MGLVVALLIGALTLGFLYLRRQMSYWKSRGVPSLEPSYLLGNLSGVGETTHLTLQVQRIYEAFKDNHAACGFYLLQSPRLVLIDLELIKNVLIRDFHNFIDRGVYVNEEDDPLSAHLFALEGEKWKNLRHKLSATFTSGKMRLMCTTIEAYSRGLVDLIDSLAGDTNGIDVKNVCLRFTADVIGACGFGIECNAMREENVEMMRMGKFFDISDTLTRANFFFVNTLPRLAKRLRMSVTPQFISDFFLPMIRRAYELRVNSDAARNDFLSLLIQIKKYGKLRDEEIESVGTLTFNELAAQAFIFFIAGFETSSTTMTMALYELAYRHDIQTRLRSEIESVASRHGDEITYDAIAEMPFLEQVINETLRLYSPIGLLFRVALADYRMDESLVIEKGTAVFIPAHAIHHDCRYYHDPENFIPERFAPEEVKKRPQFSFLPFGSGNRNCIGMRFGLMQTKIGIATVVKNFRLSHHPTTRYPLVMDPKSIVVTSQKPILIKAERI